jgi:Amt family ammonium transporter
LAGGGLALLAKQAIAVIATMAFSLAATSVVLKLVDATVGLRVAEEDETAGLDISQHSEVGYAFAEGGSYSPPTPPPAPAPAPTPVPIPQRGEA